MLHRSRQVSSFLKSTFSQCLKTAYYLNFKPHNSNQVTPSEVSTPNVIDDYTIRMLLIHTSIPYSLSSTVTDTKRCTQISRMSVPVFSKQTVSQLPMLGSIFSPYQPVLSLLPKWLAVTCRSKGREPFCPYAMVLFLPIFHFVNVLVMLLFSSSDRVVFTYTILFPVRSKFEARS